MDATSPPHSLTALKPENVSADQIYESISHGAASSAMVIASMLLAVLNLLLFFVEAYVEGCNLLHHFTRSLYVWTNFIASSAIITFLLSALVLGWDNALWDAAAIGVLFAWFTVGLSLQFVQVLNIGVYITMMISTMKLVVIVTSSLLVFLLGFAFAFHILLGSVTTLQYDTIELSMFSTLHSLIATTDFTGIVNIYQEGGLRYTVLVFVLLVMLIIMLPIVFINLLIGLAIGDVDRIQRDATFTRQSIEVHSLSSVDSKFIPYAITELISKRHHKVYPNKHWLGSRLKKVLKESLFTPNIPDNGEHSSLHNMITEKFDEFHSKFFDKFEKRLTACETLQSDKLKHLEDIIDAKMKRFEGLLEVSKGDKTS